MTLSIYRAVIRSEHCHEKIIENKADEAAGKVGFGCLALDTILFISALTFAILAQTHIVALPPAGMYPLYAAAGLIFILDLGTIIAANLRKNDDDNE